MDRSTTTRIARRPLTLALIGATVIGLSAIPAQSVTKKAKKPKVTTTKAAKKPIAIPTTAAVTTVAVTTVASTAAALTTVASTTPETAPSSSTGSVPTTPPATPTSAAGPAAVVGGINIVGFSFGDRSISVKVGPVSITNQDGDAHTVTADDGSFSESVGPKQTATLTVAKPGTFKFHCNIHPSMTGTLVVT